VWGLGRIGVGRRLLIGKGLAPYLDRRDHYPLACNPDKNRSTLRYAQEPNALPTPTPRNALPKPIRSACPDPLFPPGPKSVLLVYAV
jgi:hypothetical protein